MATLKGGTALDKRLKEIAERLGTSHTLRVGFMADATYPDGTSVAMVAAIQDFGAPAQGIPPRPFFRNMVAEKSPTWGTGLATVLKASNYDAERSLGLMGEAIKGELQESILQTSAPPLSPKTVKRKGFDKPLVDTSHMLNSVDFKVD